MKKCKHERTRYLDCEEHDRGCWIIICCDCGETVEEDEDLQNDK